MKIAILLAIAFVAFTQSALAQPTDIVALKKIEMKKVDKVVGKWVGGGWKQVGPKRENMSGSEIVQRKLDGIALLIEGRFTDSAGEVKHETLAIMAYDEALKAHRFKSFLRTGMSGEFDLKVTADGFEWGFPVQGGQVRFSIKLDNETWHETGEFSRDGGATWMKTMEMTLRREK
jgi:hypothetical protein